MSPAVRNAVTICLLLLTGADIQAQKKGYDHWGYPVFDSVVSYLSERVDPNDFSGYRRFRLAKKSGGWYLYAVDYTATPVKPGPEIKCWDKAKGKYVYDASKYHPSDRAESQKQFKQQVELQEVKHYYIDEPCFGYMGWTYDVYAMMEGKDKLADYDIHALAYAYSCEEGYRIGYQGDYVPKELSFKLGSYPGHMTSAQVDTLRKYNALAVRTYKRLWQENPNYQTLIGNVWLKYSNEILCGFLDLTYLQSKEEGRKQLTKEELYDPVILAFAQNLLTSCDKDGILFTQGDNDTYPLYYLQAVKGVRTDVLVVNLSLLGTSMYINAARSGLIGNSSIPFNLHPSEYEDDKLDYIQSRDANYSRLEQVDDIPVKIERPYLLKNEIAMIDIINANKWKRPIYFASSVATDAFLGLDNYLRFHGLVYQLTTSPSSGSNKDIDTAFTYDFFMNKLSVTDWNKQSYTDWNTWAMSMNECNVMIQEANLLKNIGEDKNCLALLDKMMAAFPEEKIKRDFFFAPVPELYYSCGEKTKATTLAETIIKESRKKYNDNIKKTDIGAEEWSRNIQESLYSYQVLSGFYNSKAEYESTGKVLKKELEDKLAVFERLQKQKNMD